ncbi:hypothetical protein EKA83_07525 [Pseudomonas veronii]|nr:hypothetical protein EKA83_07525 [Pseudomonas veronii]
MPMRPRLLTYVCINCGWRKTVAPQSDVLRPGYRFDRCPQCQSTSLTTRPPGLLERTLVEFLSSR